MVTGFDRAGRPHFSFPLPARGHGMAFHPIRAECVVFARRPGNFAYVLDCETPTICNQIKADETKHFQGHGTFSEDGRYLFATENDYQAGRGVLGAYDAADNYLRVGELPTHGIGPHEVRLMPGGDRIAVANGGIRTHPDLGRAKLNIPTMKPNLAVLDSRSGKLLARAVLPKELHKLSVRHIDIAEDGRIAFAMQYEGDRRHQVPLAGLLDGNLQVSYLRPPPQIETRFRHYTGSIAFDRSGQFIAVSSPRGHLATLWNARSGKLLHAVDASDASGLAPTSKAGEFLVSSGEGSLQILSSLTGKSTTIRNQDEHLGWDNHLGATLPW